LSLFLSLLLNLRMEFFMDLREALDLVLQLAANNMLTPDQIADNPNLDTVADKQQDAFDKCMNLLNLLSEA